MASLSTKIWANRLSIVSSMALMRGLHVVDVPCNLFSFSFKMHMFGRRNPMYIFVSACRMFSACATGFMTRTYSSKNATSVLVNLATSSLAQSFLNSSYPRSLIRRISHSAARNTEFHRVAFGRLSLRPYVSVTASTAIADRLYLFHIA